MAQDINTYTSNTSGGSESPKKVTGTDVSGKRGLDVNIIAGAGASTVYALRLDDVTGVSYVGEALPGALTSGASWRIKRITETGPDLVIEFADGNSSFDNIWDNRLALSYS